MCKLETPNSNRTTDVLLFVNDNSLFLMKVVDGFFPMEMVEEKLRDLSTSCI